MEEKKILIVAGDPSADLHGANLIKELKKEGNFKFYGIGGENFLREKVNLIENLRNISAIGFFELFFKLPYYYFLLKKILKEVKNNRPEIAILIDFPGFNFVLMKKLWEMEIPVVYYICPQIWAWGEERIEKLSKYCKKLLLIFPFEENFYRERGVEGIYVGHPLLDYFKEKKNFRDGKIKIGIFPGSRKIEVKKLLKPMLEISVYLKKNLKNIEFFIKPYPLLKDYISKELKKFKIEFNEIKEDFFKLDFSFMASGTITLENGLAENPGIVLYKLNPLTYFFIKRKIKTKYISIVNILLDEIVYEEFIQRDIDVKKIREFVLNLILDGEKLKLKREKLSNLKKILKHGAVEKAKKEILKLLK